jgi:F-type H+-transporting ATPase subunit b
VEISWSTFVLEIVNFLILVWILQHFLYRPVLDVIARRRAGIQKTLEDAKSMREEAQSLQRRYEGRLADWNAEKQQAADALRREVDAERKKRMQQLDEELAREREQAEVAERRRREAARREVEAQAIKHAASFATRLLERVSGPDVEARLVDLGVAELEQLPDEKRKELGADSAQSVRIVSAFALADAQREALTQALRRLLGEDLPLEFAIDTSLLAGFRIEIGAKTIALNLREELAGFALLSAPTRDYGWEH